MEVLILQVFVSLMLVTGSVVLFLFTCRQRDFDHDGNGVRHRDDHSTFRTAFRVQLSG